MVEPFVFSLSGRPFKVGTIPLGSNPVLSPWRGKGFLFRVGLFPGGGMMIFFLSSLLYGDLRNTVLGSFTEEISPLISIDGEVITTLDRDIFLLYTRLNRGEDPYPIPSEEERKKAFLALLRTHLLYLLAREERVIPPLKEVEEEMKRFSELLSLEGESRWKEKIGVSFQRFRFEAIRKGVVKRYLHERVVREVYVSPQEVEEYWQRDPLLYRKPLTDFAEMIERYLFLEKWKELIRDRIRNRFRSSQIRWFVSPVKEEEIFQWEEER
jgi:hypothetical protein